jgi:hypothetical protein
MINTNKQQIELLARELLVESIKEGRETKLNIEGYSMQPMLKSADEVFFKKTKDLSFGDLAVYRKNGAFIVHRFIRKKKMGNEDFFILKADNSLEVDEPVSDTQIIGVVTKVNRQGKLLELGSLSGKVRSLSFFIFGYLKFVFNKVFFVKRDYFIKERTILKLFAKDKINEAEETQLLGLLKANPDWGYLTEKAKWNFITPFFIERIKSLRIVDYIPGDSWQKLENIHRMQIVNDTKIRRILNIVLTEFSNKGIEVILLKGMHLGMEIYEDTSQRWAGDADLLIKESDWLKVCGILSGSGFLTAGQREIDSWALRYLDCHIDFYKDDITLEIKTNIWPIDFPYFDYNLWKGARKLQFEGQSFCLPSLEDTLLIACINIIRHNFEGLIWFMDIKKTIDKFGQFLDWGVFLDTAKKHDLGVIVYYAFIFTDSLLTLNLPENFLSKLKPNVFVDTLFNLFWDKDVILLKKQGRTFKAKIPFECALVLFCGKFSFRPRKLVNYIIYLIRVIFPPSAYIQSKYKVSANPLLLLRCYLLRLANFLFVIFSLIFKLSLRIKR